MTDDEERATRAALERAARGEASGGQEAAADDAGVGLAEGVGAPGDAALDPFALASAWLARAGETEPEDANAMALATASADGLPNVRMVLLKEIEPAGAEADGRGAFVFYTNFDSQKGAELAGNARAAIVLHWKSLRRQVRARGRVERVSANRADAYYRSRAYLSRVGAWASRQSRPLESRAALAAEALSVAARWPLGPPRPPFWGGFRLIPDEIEFWSDGAFRLHDRWRRRWYGDRWIVDRLNP